MRDIENEAEALHLAQQITAPGIDAPAGVGAVGVNAGAIMRRTDRAQSLLGKVFQMLLAQDRIGPLENQDEADRKFPGSSRPAPQLEDDRVPRDHAPASSRPP